MLLDSVPALFSLTLTSLEAICIGPPMPERYGTIIFKIHLFLTLSILQMAVASRSLQLHGMGSDVSYKSSSLKKANASAY